MSEIPAIPAPPELCRDLRPVRQLREFSQQYGSIALGMSRLLQEAGISIEIEGSTAVFNNPDCGKLLVGNHKHGLEAITLLGAYGDSGHSGPLHFVANRYSLQARIISSLGDSGRHMLLPVVPSSLASGQTPRLNRQLPVRLANAFRLPTAEAIAHANQAALSNCSRYLSQGRSAALFPAGGGVNAATHAWRPGIGKMIMDLPDAGLDSIQIIPFDFPDFSVFRLVRAVTAYSYGLSPRPTSFRLQLGQTGTVREIAGPIHNQNALDITEAVRQHYVAQFGNSPDW